MATPLAVQKWVDAGYDRKNAFPSLHNNRDIVVGRNRGGNTFCYYPSYECCFLCPRIGGDRDGRGAAISVIIGLIFSAITAFFWSVSAARDALDNHDEYVRVKTQASQEARDSAIVYKGMRDERTAAAVARFMIAGGLAVLIACAAIYCLNDYIASNTVYTTLAAGSGITTLGVIGYGVKSLAFRGVEEEEACRRLMNEETRAYSQPVAASAPLYSDA